ncbi:hypothetical protein Poli38472_003511 [Pythium oligandrum]|uniref:CAP-Gly domain-containing protein n=1 Tax=Pythium oligandrum TaxID=41045 RepID=A0A8K1FCU0_PYTOL|nr:hypothetical protein Poli38472_003511 [Pythium oligandrum]|eukprot:TMW57586.1 hypothetical protein Poli38472_003511 [Pythium oligandrum]
MASGIPKPRTTSFSLQISHTLGSSLPGANNVGRVPIDSRVVLSQRRAGYVRYVGKLKNANGEWYGVALDEAKGDNDGSWAGERYFQCPPQHGVFVRRKEIHCAKGQSVYHKSPPSPVLNSPSDDGVTSSNTSVSSLDAGEVAPLPTSSSILSPLERTFKSFRRVLQSPPKANEVIECPSSPTGQSKLKEPTPRKSMRPSFTTAVASHIPQPVAHEELPKPSNPVSIFDAAEDPVFEEMTRALAEHNNAENSRPSPRSSSVLPLPPHLDGIKTPPSTTTHLRRPSIDRRHSTFTHGTSNVAYSATTNAARVVELEKEITAMRANHENVVAVLRATNKQHAANVLELRTQVSALADGNSWLQKQLSSKVALLAELRQSDRKVYNANSDMQDELATKNSKIEGLEQEIARLKQTITRMLGEKESLLLQIQREFRARQQRDQDRIQRLREDVVTICNERNSLQSELQDFKDMSWSLF